MDADDTKRVRLSGGPDASASSATIRADGSLVVELFDFSERAHDCYGNDVAFLLVFDPAAKPALLELLEKDSPVTPPRGDEDDLLLRLLAERFPDYFHVERWCESCAVPFRKEFDDWA